jgi:Phage tail tube protein
MALPKFGIKALYFAGTRVPVRGSVSHSPGGRIVNPDVGLDGHLFATVTRQPAVITAEVSDTVDLDLLAQLLKEDQSCSMEKEDGRILVLDGASMGLDSEINDAEGTVTIKITGAGLQELKP